MLRLISKNLTKKCIIYRSLHREHQPAEISKEINNFLDSKLTRELSNREITDKLNTGQKLPRSLITENAWQISLFEPEPPKSVRETIDQLLENARLDFVDSKDLRFTVTMHCPAMKLKKDKTYGWTHFFTEMPNVFMEPNEMFVFAEDMELVNSLKDAGMYPHALDSQGLRTMLANPIQHDIFASEAALMKKMNKDQRIRAKLEHLYPMKQKNTTSDNFPVMYDWITELERLRDRCIVCTTNSNNYTEVFGNGELNAMQLEENLNALLEACTFKFRDLAHVKMSYGNDEFLEFIPPVIEFKNLWQNQADGKAKSKKDKKKNKQTPTE